MASSHESVEALQKLREKLACGETLTGSEMRFLAMLLDRVGSFLMTTDVDIWCFLLDKR